MSIIPYIDEVDAGGGPPPPPPPPPPEEPDLVLTHNFTQDLYDALRPMQYMEELYGDPLYTFCLALCMANDLIAQYARDDGDYPGWSIMLDVDRAPTSALPWLGQFVGVRLSFRLPGETTEQWTARMRQRIRNKEGFDRGSVPAIVAAAQQYLTGTKTVMLDERDTGPYHFSVFTFSDETPNPGVVQSALLGQKPAGVMMSYAAISRHSYGELDANFATYAALDAAYDTYAQIQTG